MLEDLNRIEIVEQVDRYGFICIDRMVYFR